MIRIGSLKKKYGDEKNGVLVLKGIDLEIPDGKLVCILGPSGSGKSTLLNILGGIEIADEGTIEVDGQRLDQMDFKQLGQYRRKNLGFVFQFYNLIDNLTVKENIEVGEYLSEHPLDLDKMIRSLGLEEHRNKYPHQISGGQAQRTSIARAMIKNPSLLICDEPTGALDYESAKDVLRLIEELGSSRTATILIATHNTRIASMCDMVLKLRDGKIAERVENEHPLRAEEVEW